MGMKRKKSEQKGAPPWLVSMGDMNNLLMCFFIVMMGDVTVIPQEEFKLMMTSFKASLGIMQGGASLSKGRLMEMGHNIMQLPSSQKGRVTSAALKRAVEAFKPEIEAKKIRMREDERGLVITLSGDAYFDPGSARLREDIKPILKKLGQIIKAVPNFVRIEGHTDNRAMGPGALKEGFETNWELSSARSINVLRFLAEDESVNPKQLSAVAFGQYRPIDDNGTPEGRAYNRRVDIVILREKFVEDSGHKAYKKPLPDEEWR